MGLGILGRRLVIPRWANDHVWRHGGGNVIEGQGGCGCPLPPPGRKSGYGRIIAERVKKSILRNN